MSIPVVTNNNANYQAAGTNRGGKDTSKIEQEIKDITKKIKDEEQSFDSADTKKAKKQQLEAQLSQKKAELQQAQQSGSNSNNVNTSGSQRKNSDTDELKSAKNSTKFMLLSNEMDVTA
jgi:hypothetical protein